VVANCNGRSRNDDVRKTAWNEEETWWKVYQVNKRAGQVFWHQNCCEWLRCCSEQQRLRVIRRSVKDNQAKPALLYLHYSTDPVEQSHSWEANWFAASREIPRILWNRKVHYLIALHLLIKKSKQPNISKRTFISLLRLRTANDRLKNSFLVLKLVLFYMFISPICQSQWPHALRRGSAAAGLLGLRVRIPLRARISFFCKCCVLSGREIESRLWRDLPHPSWPALGLTQSPVR